MVDVVTVDELKEAVNRTRLKMIEKGRELKEVPNVYDAFAIFAAELNKIWGRSDDF